MHNSGHQIQEFGVNCQTSANFSTYILLKTTQYSHFNALIRYAVCIFGNIFNCYYSEHTNVQIVMNKDSAINAHTNKSKQINNKKTILVCQFHHNLSHNRKFQKHGSSLHTYGIKIYMYISCNKIMHSCTLLRLILALSSRKKLN